MLVTILLFGGRVLRSNPGRMTGKALGSISVESRPLRRSTSLCTTFTLEGSSGYAQSPLPTAICEPRLPELFQMIESVTTVLLSYDVYRPPPYDTIPESAFSAIVQLEIASSWYQLLETPAPSLVAALFVIAQFQSSVISYSPPARYMPPPELVAELPLMSQSAIDTGPANE